MSAVTPWVCKCAALSLDTKRSVPYWGTKREMFARAFASYVSDKLRAMGCHNDYLVYGANEGRYTGERYPDDPNPSGEERRRFNELFDGVFAEYRKSLSNEATVAAEVC